jgi:prolyl-tRNA synthetase
MPEETTTFNIDKKKNFSEWFSKIIEVAELADLRNEVKGFIVFRPWAVRAMKHMYRLYEWALEKRGHWPAIFPALIPESLLKTEKDHVEGFAPEVFWIEEAGGTELPERYVMRPTSETLSISTCLEV